MNNHLIVNFRPFVMQQEVFIYQNGEMVKKACPIMNELRSTVEQLCKEYNIERVNICGSPKMSANLVKGLQVCFANKNITIEVTPH